MRKTLTIFAFATTLLTGAAAAQTIPATPPAPRMPFGTPGPDGTIARAAVIADADRRFAALDANGDGTVTADEMRAAREKMRADRQRMREGPRPERQPMTAQAFRDRMLQRFDRADANRDGRLDAAEMQAMRDRRGSGGPRGGPRGAVPAPATQDD